MFFSLSISWGGLFMFGSYNKFKHRVHITSTVISSLDFVTSIIASVLVFSILGAQSKETGIPLEDLVQGGKRLTGQILHNKSVSVLRSRPRLHLVP